MFSAAAGPTCCNWPTAAVRRPLSLASGGTHAINTPVVLESNASVTVASGASLTISGAISESGGSQGLALSGGGSLTLSGSNSYSGGTTVGGGTLNATTRLRRCPTRGLISVGSGGRLVLGGGSGIGAVCCGLVAGPQRAMQRRPQRGDNGQQ